MKTLRKEPIEKSTRIGVLYGGLSSERDVSLRSGQNCFEALGRLGYSNVVLIDVDRNVADKLTQEKIEVAFLTLHGKYGEDGCIQGLLEIMGIAYTGCSVEASALTMNKDRTKTVLKEARLPVIDSITVNLSKESLKDFNYTGPLPVMVKPILEGSSVGMSKVDTIEQLEPALREASKYNAEVMLEAYVEGKSVTVGVIDIKGKPTVTPILELRSKTGWYDFEAKYTEGLTEFILPAELDEPTTKKVQELTLQAHLVTGCHGISRIDFIVDADNNCYILEINTIPGMTNLSDLPAQAKTIGISYNELVEYILQTAVAQNIPAIL